MDEAAGLVDQMTATVFRQSYVTQRPSLFTLISYCAIVFSFALMFTNGWFTACDGFYGASAYWLSHMKHYLPYTIHYKLSISYMHRLFYRFHKPVYTYFIAF